MCDAVNGAKQFNVLIIDELTACHGLQTTLTSVSCGQNTHRDRQTETARER